MPEIYYFSFCGFYLMKLFLSHLSVENEMVIMDYCFVFVTFRIAVYFIISNINYCLA